MNTHPPIDSLAEYRAQITACARALAVADNAVVAPFLPAGVADAAVKMFTDGNLDKRFQKLTDQLELLADSLDDLEELIVRYVRTVPLAAYDTGCTDAERFLLWLPEQRELTPAQRDLVACQRSRHAVEFAGRKQRLAHVRFQELASMAEPLSAEWGTNPELRIALNPIHVWATFETTALLDEDTDVPASVLFFAVRNEVRTAVLEADGRELVRALAISGPCRLDDLIFGGAAGVEQDELIDLCRDLAEMGLAAFE
jgi:hypothetical protein